MEVKNEPLSADGDEEYTLNHRKNSERPVQVKEEPISSSFSHQMDAPEMDDDDCCLEVWNNSEFSFDTCELAD